MEGQLYSECSIERKPVQPLRPTYVWQCPSFRFQMEALSFPWELLMGLCP